jgi:xanthine dehydrogenase YagT iron-sulfur-binding subunit
MDAQRAELALTINGERREISVDTRATLLDVLREQLALTGAKKGCDHGQCGACTVLVGGRRANACLMLAVAVRGEVTTIEGLAGGEGELHPVQQAFVAHDALQCGYCTPGQICSAIGMLEEVREGWPSAVTEDLLGDAELGDAEIRERMSGNLCRCGAYANIVPAISEAGR